MSTPAQGKQDLGGETTVNLREALAIIAEPDTPEQRDEAWDEITRHVATLEARLAEAVELLRDLHEQVEMDESIGRCLSDRVASLRAGDFLAALPPESETR